MNDTRRAVQDLNWLATRLQGIISLGAELTSHEAFTTQTKELSQQAADRQKVIEDLIEQHKAATDKLDSLKQDISNQEHLNNQKVAEGIAAAEKAAEEVKQKAAQDLEAWKEEQRQEQERIHETVMAKYRELDEVNTRIKSSRDKHINLEQELKALKEKF